MNEKYATNKKEISVVKDVIDDDKYDFTRSDENNVRKKGLIDEADLQNEVYRLQNTLKQMSEDFACQRKQLEDDCCAQLKKLNEDTEKTQRLQQDLEQGLIFDK